MTLEFLWDSLYGLIFGFLISAVAQVAVPRRALARTLGGNLRGIATGAAFGIVASACSYGAAAAARGLLRKGGDLRAVFAFLISSTNMNVAILIMFWALVGWRFAFAEFFGGVVIIAVVATGFTLLFGNETVALAQPAQLAPAESSAGCSHCAGSEPAEDASGGADLRQASTWRDVLDVAGGDFAMLRGDLAIGFTVAGFAAALVPRAWLSGALHAVAAVPFVGYPLLLLTGLAIAVLTFVCSMGNVPIARYLAMAGIPLGANTTFIYGDLLIPPLIGIYRKSFPPQVVWSFLALFVVGALAAGALMDLVIGQAFGEARVGSMDFSDRFTLVANSIALLALFALFVVARRAAATPREVTAG